MSTATEDRTATGRRALPLAEANDPATCGHKAATLAALLGDGFAVPDGFVIPVGVDGDAESVHALLERMGPGPWAVRSSGVAEDLEDASYAGQYETVLGVVTADEVVAAAARVRASGRAAHVAVYGRAQGAEAGGAVAVLVQRMVAADAAGIAFSANPVTGDDEVVIEAVPGLADGLASGDVDGERWVVAAGVARPPSAPVALDGQTALRIAALAREVARARGAPQDIEWAMRGGDLFLLQARPITELPLKPEFTVPPGRWVKDTTHFSGPMTPVGASILLPLLEAGFVEVFQEWGFPLERFLPRSFGGEIYMQEIEPGGKHNPGSPPPWWAGAIAFRVVPALRRIARAAEAALPKIEAYPRAWDETWKDECVRKIDEARKVDLQALDDAALLGHLDHVVTGVLQPGVRVHFRLMVPDMVALHDLATCCEELLGWDTAKTLELLAGLSATARGPAEAMAPIARDVDDDVLAQGLDAVRRSPVGPRLDEWLDLWGLRTLDLDPGSPTVAEREELVMALLREPGTRTDATERARQAAVTRARAALDERGDDRGRARFDRVLAVAEHVHPQREGNVLYTQSLPMGLARRALLEIGRRLVAAGELVTPEDVVFLEVDEAKAALLGTLAGPSADARARRRRAERRWVSAHPGPLHHGPAPVPPPSVRGLPAAMRRIVGALVWEIAHEDSPAGLSELSTEDGVLVGAGASSGRVTGRVRVIRHEAELGRLEPGEILVCPTTHSTWAVVFSRAAALVTDHGGMLSHPAIVAREHGIPAVLGTGTATSTLVDGQIVTVDGGAGKVEVAVRS